MNLNPNKSNPQILGGWKEIANYLGKGVRTVQRYERELGLPVRRAAGKSGASVIATKVEIDAWVDARPYRNDFPLAKLDKNFQRAALTALKVNIAEMHELRKQMTALRDDIHTSRNLLHENVLGLVRELDGARPTRKRVN